MDLTRDPIPGIIRRIGVPFALGMIFNTMFNVTDTFFAGRLSTDALAALSMSMPMFFLIMGPGIGIQAGSSALIANSLGAGEGSRAVRYQIQAIILGLIVAVVISVALQLGLPALYRLFGAEGEVLAGGLRYMRVIAAGGVIILLSQVLNAGLMARGDTRAFRNVLIVMALANVGLDPLLMFGLRIGGVQVIPMMREAGTALATVGLQGVGICYLVIRSRRQGVYDGAMRADWRPSRKLLGEVIAQSAPAALDFLVMTVGSFVIIYYISAFGRDAVAGYGAALRIEQIALLPLFGISTALGTLVGQNNGARRIDRVEESFRVSVRLSIVAAITILTPVLLAAAPLLRLFTNTEPVVAVGRRYLYIQGITYFSYILINLSNATLRGLKRPLAIMWASLFRQAAAPLLVFPLLAYALGMRENGVFWGLAIVNWIAALFSFWWSRRMVVRARRAVEDPPVAEPSAAEVTNPTAAASD